MRELFAPVAVIRQVVAASGRKQLGTLLLVAALPWLVLLVLAIGCAKERGETGRQLVQRGGDAPFCCVGRQASVDGIRNSSSSCSRPYKRLETSRMIRLALENLKEQYISNEKFRLRHK